MTKKNNTSANYLDFVPMISQQIRYEDSKDGEVTILKDNKGAFNRIAQLLFRKPKVSQIHLDEMGNFIWPLINGKNSVYDISVYVKDHFGDKAEPLYNRLVQYIKTLEAYGFIEIKKD